MSCELVLTPDLLKMLIAWFATSTKLDAEKRLALQREKESLDLKLLEVYVRSLYPGFEGCPSSTG